MFNHKTMRMVTLFCSIAIVVIGTSHFLNSEPYVGGIDSENVNLVGALAGGSPRKVSVQGNYAYVAADRIFSIIDITNPSNPQQISFLSIPGNAYGVYVAGNYAYVANGNDGLRIIDITNPAVPYEVGNYQTSGQVYDVYVINNYAYVADGTGGLRIIDITNPSVPTEAGFYDTGVYANGVHVSGNYAYIVDLYFGLRIIDITNLSSLSEVGLCVTSGHKLDVYVTGNYAYVADGIDGLKIIDITNPASPSEVGICDTPGFALGVHIEGNYAYVADKYNGLRIINISNKNSPAEVGFCGTPGQASDSYVSGNFAYVADFTGGLRIIDISNPVAPSETGWYNTPNAASAMYISSNYAYVVDFDRGVSIIDITNPASPSEVGYYNGIGATDVYVTGNYAYVTDRSGWLRIIDITNPALPSEVNAYNTQGSASGVHVVGNYAYVVNNRGLIIIDITNPLSLSEAGFWDTPGNSMDVQVIGTYAYVADLGGGLRIIDITNPASPSEVGFFDQLSANNLYVSGNYAYIAAGSGGLRIIDITNPASLSEVGICDTLGHAVGVSVSGNYAYVADFFNGLRVISISNPINPQEIGFYQAAGHATKDVHILNGLAYVAVSESGLWVLQYTPPGDQLQVQMITEDPSGFVITFNRPLDTRVLNLYDRQSGAYGSADVTVVGNMVGTVRGSLIYYEHPTTLCFIKTGGPFEPDTYTITLRSDEDAFKDTDGNLLDGDADGAAGGNYVTTINISPSTAVLLSIPDFCRGPGQDVNVPATGAGIPVTISDASGIEKLEFKLFYDPDFVKVIGISIGPPMPQSWQMTVVGWMEEEITVTLSGPSLPSGELKLVNIHARIPNDALYSEGSLMGLSSIVINDGAIPAQADSAIAVVAYPGDATGNYRYSGLDAAYIARSAVGLDSGFARYRMKDPILIGDVTGDGRLSGLDAAYFARKAVGLEVPQIPDLPGILPALIADGPDPLLSIPDDLTAEPGDALTVPIQLDDATGLEGADVVLQYDTNVFDLTAQNIKTGDLLDGWSLVANVNEPSGTVKIIMYNTTPHTGGGGTIVSMNVDVSTDAYSGPSVIDLQESSELNEGALVLTLDDGTVTIINGKEPPGEKLVFTGEVASSSSITWNWNEITTVDEYRIYAAENNTLVHTLQSGVTSWMQEGLTPNTYYGLYIVSVNGNIESSPTDMVTLCTFAELPSELTVQETQKNTMTVSWNGNGGSTYDIVVSKNSDFSVTAGFAAVTEQTAVFQELESDTSYWFKVRGYNKDSVPTNWTEAVMSRTTPEKKVIRLSVNIDVRILNNSSRLLVNGQTHPGAVLESIQIEDKFGSVLDINTAGWIDIDEETGEITGEIDAGLVRKKYPLVAYINIKLQVQKDEQVAQAESGIIYLQATANKVTCYNNVINPAQGQKVFIMVELMQSAHLKLILYDTRGNKVMSLADEDKEAGLYQFVWNGKDDNNNTVGSGMYFIHMRAGGFKSTKKIVVVR